MRTDKKTTPKPLREELLSIFRLLAVAILTSGLGAGQAWATQHHSLSAIAQQAKIYLEREGGRQFGDNLSVEIQAPDPRLRLAACSESLEVFTAPGARSFGNTSVGVRCAGLVPWTIYLRARVRVWMEVLVSRGPLSRGDRVGENDLMVQKMDISQVNGRFLQHPSQAVDLELRRTLAPGVVLTQNMLRAPELIKRGDRVTLLARAGNLSVRVAGKALTSGAMGDQISVENLSSRRRVQGVVSADGVVRTDHGALSEAGARLGANSANSYTNPKDFIAAADPERVF